MKLIRYYLFLFLAASLGHADTTPIPGVLDFIKASTNADAANKLDTIGMATQAELTAEAAARSTADSLFDGRINLLEGADFGTLALLNAAPAGTLTGSVLAANVTGSSLTSAAGGSFGVLAYSATAPAGTLTGTTLASGIITSSLSTLGTLSSLAVTGASSLNNTTWGNSAAFAFGNVSAATNLRTAILAAPVPVYVDSRAADDSGTGYLPTSPKKTLAAAAALLQPGGKLVLLCGSRWNEDWPTTPAFVQVETTGQGVPPIVDGSRLISAGSWTAHATAADVYQTDVTFPDPIFNFGLSGRWHPMLWDEDPAGELNGGRLTYYNAGVSVAANIAYVEANPGTFTVQKIGGTNPIAAEDIGTQFRYFAHLSDDSSPASNGRPVYHVAQSILGIFAAGIRVSNVTFQRSGGKDFMGTTGGAMKPERFERCQFLECAVHGPVFGGVEFYDCYAEGRSTSRSAFGAGFHNFRDENSIGVSFGCRYVRCSIKGFSIGYYSHGAGDGGAEHEYFELLDCRAEDCDTPWQSGETQRPVHVEGLKLINCGNSGTNSGTKRLIARRIEGQGPIGVSQGGALIEDCSIVRRDYSSPFADNGGIVYTQASGTAQVTVNRSTFVGLRSDQTAARRALDIDFNDCILSYFDDTSGLGWDGDVTADNTCFNLETIAESVIQADHAGIESNCVFPLRIQTHDHLVASGDVRWYGGRTATYGGTGSTLTFDFLDNQPMRAIKVVDAYGTGSHYYGVVATVVATGGGGTLTVTPAPSGAFSNKIVEFGFLNRKIFPTVDDVAAIQGDSLKFRSSLVSQYSEGMVVRVAPALGRGEARAAIITDITGDVVTLDRGTAWIHPSNAGAAYQLIAGGAGMALPTAAIGFQFTLFKGSIAFSRTPVNGGADVVYTEDAGTSSPLTGPVYSTAGADFYFGAYNFDRGFIDFGAPVAAGDIVHVSAKAIIDPWQPQWVEDPTLYGSARLKPGTELSIRGMGYRAGMN